MKNILLKKTNLVVLLVLFFLGTMSVEAQVAVNSTGLPPDVNAMLDVSSTNTGVLIPRLAWGSLPSPAPQGLIAYVNSGSPNGNGFYYYEAGVWHKLMVGSVPLAVIKGGTGTTMSFPQGSVVFVDAAGNYNYSPNFFWDDNPANQWLGLGVNPPATNFHISENTTETLPAAMIEQHGSGDAALEYGLPGVSSSFTTGIDQDDNANFEISNASGLTGTAYNDANTMMRIHTENTIPGITDFNHQSRARVYLWQNPQAIPNATWTAVDFNQTTYDEHGEFVLFPGSNPAQFTAIEEGHYQVNARTVFDVQVFEANMNGYVSIAIYKNQSVYSYGNNLQIDGGVSPGPPVPPGEPLMLEPEVLVNNNAPNVSDVVYLMAGQTIQIYVWQNFTGSADIINGSAETYVSIHKVS